METEERKLEKKEIVTLMLKKVEEIVHAGIDSTDTEGYSPLDLIVLTINHVMILAETQRKAEAEFDSDDDSGTLQ
jgi:hypothetical protein